MRLSDIKEKKCEAPKSLQGSVQTLTHFHGNMANPGGCLVSINPKISMINFSSIKSLYKSVIGVKTAF